jgi:hypothetical protein
VCLGGGVDDLVNGLHGKVERHELADRVEASQRRADGQPSEAGFRNGTVNDSLLTEAVK